MPDALKALPARDDARFRVRYVVASAVIAALGVVGALVVNVIDPNHLKVRFEAVDGLTLFVGLYVVAQIIERINTFIAPPIDWIVNLFAPRAARAGGAARTAQHRKAAALTVLETAPADDAAAVARSTLRNVRSDTTLLTQSTTFAIALVLSVIFNVSVLGVVGFTQVQPWLAYGASAFVLMGGTKGLHDLITAVSSTAASRSTAV